MTVGLYSFDTPGVAFIIAAVIGVAGTDYFIVFRKEFEADI